MISEIPNCINIAINNISRKNELNQGSYGAIRSYKILWEERISINIMEKNSINENLKQDYANYTLLWTIKTISNTIYPKLKQSIQISKIINELEDN